MSTEDEPRARRMPFEGRTHVVEWNSNTGGGEGNAGWDKKGATGGVLRKCKMERNRMSGPLQNVLRVARDKTFGKRLSPFRGNQCRPKTSHERGTCRLKGEDWDSTAGGEGTGGKGGPQRGQKGLDTTECTTVPMRLRVARDKTLGKRFSPFRGNQCRPRASHVRNACR